jgi:hypothetical protein
MIDAPKTEADLPRYLAMKLAELAMKNRKTMPGHDIAAAFISVGLQMAIYSHGAIAAAEWLRDIADESENSVFNSGRLN